MTPESSWLENLNQAFSAILAGTAERLPDMLAALAILVVGFVLGRLLRRTAWRIADGANRLLDRVFRRGVLASARLSPAMVRLLGQLLFWTVMILALTLAVQVARLTSVAGWLGRLVIQLPNLMVGAVVVIAGLLIGIYAREHAAASARSAGLVSADTIGIAVQSVVVALALIVGLDQVGVDVTLLVVLLAVLSGSLALGFFAAFALGARHFIANLIGARTARDAIRAGLQVRIGELEGRVLEITATQIALDTPQGRLLVPARMADEVTILLPMADSREAGGDR